MDAFSDLAFFALLHKHGSLAAAAQQLGVTPPAVSKRLAAVERRLGVRLLQRTTRRISLTPEGETYLVEGARVLEDLETLERTWSLRTKLLTGQQSCQKPAPAYNKVANAGGELHLP